MFIATELAPLGWSDRHDAEWRSVQQGPGINGQERFPARVFGEERGLYWLQADLREGLWGEPAGKFRNDSTFPPAVGDWVVCSRGARQPRATIHGILPRSSCLARIGAGRSGQLQVLAANVDVGFIVTSLNGDLNPRRLERYLATIRDGGAQPVVLLTKRDLCADLPAAVVSVREVAGGAPVIAVSAITGEGMEALADPLGRGVTAVLLGSSGAGKSTLVNRLLGEDRIATRSIRASDDRGRHTTSSRRLWALPSGALLIDTPGLREIQLAVDDASLDATFEDVRALELRCRFTDCRHASEPGCAVNAAVGEGTLPLERVAAYDKLRRELGFHERKGNRAAMREEKNRWKKIHRQAKALTRRKRWDG